MSKVPYKIYLTEDELPKQWYNIQADMPNPLQHGHFDLTAYEDFNSGKLVDYDYSDQMLAEGLACLPKIE